jgi:hypothetical protein
MRPHRLELGAVRQTRPNLDRWIGLYIRSCSNQLRIQQPGNDKKAQESRHSEFQHKKAGTLYSARKHTKADTKADTLHESRHPEFCHAGEGEAFLEDRTKADTLNPALIAS